MDGSIKVEETKPASGGAMPRRSLRNIGLLATCQALTQSSNTLMFASSALAVLTIVSPDMRMWANLPVTMQHLGVMLSVFPASLLMMRRGRKFGKLSLQKITLSHKNDVKVRRRGLERLLEHSRLARER